MDKGLPPPGGDQNKAAKTITIWATLTSLSIAVVTVRFIARAVGKKRYGWDDWTMLAALCLTVAKFGVDVFLMRAGFGRHIYYLDTAQIMRYKKLNFVTGLFTNLIICLVKLSVTFFLLRIGSPQRWLRYALFGTIALLVSSTVATVVIIFVQCRPIAGLWDPTVALTVKCLPTSALTDVSYCSTAMSIFTDFLCATLPVQIIWSLQMSRGTKISMLSLLCLGSLAMICGIVRITLIKNLRSETDATWDNVALAIWSSAEYFVGIIAGSIPPCRMLVLQWIPKFRGEAPPNEGTTGISNPRSSYFYSLKHFSRITNAFSRGRATVPETSRGWKGSRNSQKNYIPMRPWNVEANRAFSQDSGRESILPFHSVSRANPETGILKTVDVRVGACGSDGSLATDESAQR